MKDSLGTVLIAYEHRVEVFGRVMSDVERVLKNSRAEQETLISEIRERLAKTSSLRRKDFDRMTAGTGLSSEEGDHSMTEQGHPQSGSARKWLEAGRPETIGRVALELEKEGQSLCDMLKQACRKPGAAGASKLKALSGEILSRLVELEREAIGRLKRMQLRQEELRVALKELALKGEGIQIQDLRKITQGLRLRWEAGRTEQGELIDDLEIAQREASSRWAEALKGDEVEGAAKEKTSYVAGPSA